MVEATIGDSREVDEEAKEWEHKLLQNSMDKELHELNRRLEEKESEMKLFDGYDTAALKQYFGKKIAEVEDEKRSVQEERNRLLAEIENLASSDGQAQKLQDVHAQNLKALEAQIQDLKKKQENQVQLLKQKQKSDDAAKRLQDEIHSIKAQKVQLQHRMKQEAEQFRQWKASREKELLQLRKEGRKSEYERHKLQALNQRQKMVLQRKTEEAAMATKRLKELLEARKSSPRDHSGGTNGFGTNGQTNEKSLQRWLDHELEVMVNVHEVRHEYEKQSHVRAALAEELSVLRQVDEFAAKGLHPPRGKNGFARNRLLAEIENLASSDGQAQKLQEVHAHNLRSLEAQIQDLKKKQENQVQLLKQKQKSDDAARRLQDEIQSIKSQKLRKEGRKSEYERHKLQALNQRQKMVLQRKTEEAAMATKRLKELLEARKLSPRDHSGFAGGTNGFGTNDQTNEKSLQRWLDHELEIMVNVHEVRETKPCVRAALAEELSVLRQVDEFAAKGLSPPRGKNGFARASSLSPDARVARISSSLENMLGISSNSLVAMASQLSEEEERERAFTNRGRWNQLRSMGEAKNLLQYMFNSLAYL
ncbi:hypothetical protein F2Q69_00024692 [Brassica cretica]|uniref:Uncharacterized protein n=1 Tax=Brassica cretica TaxID=69181 RepID=A0A8S9QL19_BRACR|nr:hypothetical protein F2Q69_00024692 [Brassica cretica]